MRRRRLYPALLSLCLLLSACAPAETAQTPPSPGPRPTRPPIMDAHPVPKPVSSPAATPAGSRYLPPTPSPVPLNPLGSDIADYSLEFYGCDYRYGGKSPETGFDCSGLVWYVYRENGIELPRTSDAQAKAGELVPPDEIMPGDILCFYQGSWVGHVGIYLGDDWYVHAEGTGIGVKIAAVSDRSGKIETRRVFG